MSVVVPYEVKAMRDVLQPAANRPNPQRGGVVNATG